MKGVGILSLFRAKVALDRGDSRLFYLEDDGDVELPTQPWANPRNVLMEAT